MAFLFSTFLNTYRPLIIQKWVEKLHTECGEQYAARPVEELFQTITQAVDANYQVLVHENFHAINTFIDKITDMRLKAGFLLSDVQRAFELYRMILSDLLISNAPKQDFHEIFERLNQCLAYTMHRFSDHFQDMHQKKIIQQNRELEQIVKKRTAALQESERMAYIGHITASLSHEIRNPLSAVKMNLQILSGNQKITGNDKRRVDISVSEVIRLEQILNQLLDFAKPLQLNINSCNIWHILNSYIELLEIKFKEKNLVVETNIEDELPPLTADGDKLGQAFINILLNAIESSDPFGKISVTFKKIIKQKQEYAAVLIDDEGSGFDEKDKKEIFKPFFTTKTKGVGLGLANVKRIIKAHNGFVKAKKKKHKGASFLIMIPIGNN
ncbi:MAG: GHKL domain-containing protein [Deltaproteobacteria bacterium]|nr:GHKL domain-containing protein [Deltaproteobacteria bacterium]